MIKYVWTKKAEDRAKKLKLEERKEGEQAYYGYEKLTDKLDSGVMLCVAIPAWLKLGYITEKTNG